MVEWISIPGLTPYDKAIERMEQKLQDVINGHNETIFLLTSAETSFIASSIVRDVIRNNGDFTKLVPEAVKLK